MCQHAALCSEWHYSGPDCQEIWELDFWKPPWDDQDGWVWRPKLRKWFVSMDFIQDPKYSVNWRPNLLVIKLTKYWAIQSVYRSPRSLNFTINLNFSPSHNSICAWLLFLWPPWACCHSLQRVSHLHSFSHIHIHIPTAYPGTKITCDHECKLKYVDRTQHLIHLLTYFSVNKPKRPIIFSSWTRLVAKVIGMPCQNLLGRLGNMRLRGYVCLHATTRIDSLILDCLHWSSTLTGFNRPHVDRRDWTCSYTTLS